MAVPFLACVFTHFTRIHDLSLSCSLFILKQTLKRKKKIYREKYLSSRRTRNVYNLPGSPRRSLHRAHADSGPWVAAESEEQGVLGRREVAAGGREAVHAPSAASQAASPHLGALQPPRMRAHLLPASQRPLGRPLAGPA